MNTDAKRSLSERGIHSASTFGGMLCLLGADRFRTVKRAEARAPLVPAVFHCCSFVSIRG